MDRETVDEIKRYFGVVAEDSRLRVLLESDVSELRTRLERVESRLGN